ncbi:DUF3795 domain-containing protein [Chloroflexota bacterium]
MGDCELSIRRLAAVCGRYCAECDAVQDGLCCGCGYQLGQTRRGECAVYQCCVMLRGLEHCGLCLDFPCQVFASHASPLDVGRRYKALRRRAEIGTAAWLLEQEQKLTPS